MKPLRNVAWVGAACLLCCGFVTLPIDKAANRSRTDRLQNDGRGGWLDLGANDLSVLSAGRQVLAGVSFEIPPGGDENARNCIVIGRKGPEEVSLPVTKKVKHETCLILLHATTEGKVGDKVGDIVMSHADGSVATKAVVYGTDIADWMSGRGYRNATKVWSEYNGVSQASMYASAFALKDSRLTNLTFRATGASPWMIVAATASERARIRPLGRCLEINRRDRSPEPPAKPLVRFNAGMKPKNVILIIGDGMGQGAARITSYYKYGKDDALFFNRFPVVGLCSTRNILESATDSAAAATAIATGEKTTNGRLGLADDGLRVLTSVAARAKAKGMGVALVTSDQITGATPGGFYARVPGRGDKSTIGRQAAESGYDILIGNADSLKVFRPKSAGGSREDGRDLLGEMRAKGYTVVTNQAGLDASSGKVIGGLAFASDVSIADAMKAAFARLGNNGKGFFMMAECAATDGAGHGNNPSWTVGAVTQVEFMAKAAVDFALERDDTLVLVTADHETGGAFAVRGPDGRMTVDYTTSGHTSLPVPIHAFGPGAERFEGLIDNIDIAKTLAVLLSLP